MWHTENQSNKEKTMESTWRRNHFSAFAVAALLIVTSMASAADVTWQNPGTTEGEKSIDVASGNLAHAGYFGKTDHGTVNVIVGNKTIPFSKAGNEQSGHKVWISHGFKEDNHYRGEGSAEFQKVMDGVTHNTGLAPILTLGRLNVGATYQIQLFAVNEQEAWRADHEMRFSDNKDNVSEEFTVGSRSFVIGTFTADGPTQNIKLVFYSCKKVLVVSR